MSTSSYLDIALAENETSINLTAVSANFEAVHIFDGQSIYAINAALASGRPLLVRGEPGVGKSQLAHAAARQLGRVFLQCVVDIQTEAEDLLWRFNSVRRLAEAQIAGAFARWLADEFEKSLREWEAKLALSRFIHPGPLWWAFDWKDAKAQAIEAQSSIPSVESYADPARGVVLLIDEIDKAEADVPNGLLEALGAGQFKPSGRVSPVKSQHPHPLVVITTNEERALPNAFIRRCLVLNMELPQDEKELIRLLVKRGARHFPEIDVDVLKSAAGQLALDRRSAIEQGLRPLPGQAEYMDLLRALQNLCPGNTKKQQKLLKNISHFALKKLKNDM